MSRTSDMQGRHRLVAVTALLLAATTSLAACGSDDATGGDSAGTTYHVGAPLVLSGPAAFAGEPVANGAKLAVAEINESNFLGDGSTVDVKTSDTGGDPAKAIAAFKQFEADEVSGVLCCTLAGEAGALAPLLEKSPVPAIVTVSILEGLAKAPHLFRPFEVPSAEGGMYDEFLDTVLAGGRYGDAVMVVNNDNDSMVQDGKVYAQGLERNGVKLVDTINVATAETSFTGVATQIIDADPDVVVTSTIGSSTANLARALRERGFDGPIVSNVGAESRSAYDASNEAMAGTIFPTPYHAGFPPNELASKFAASYEAEYGMAPDMFAAQGYTAMWLLATGIRDAGSDDPAKVGAALSQIKEQETVYGDITFHDGQAELADPALILLWGKGGQVTKWSGG